MHTDIVSIKSWLFFFSSPNLSFLKIYFSLLCELFLLHVCLFQLANLGWVSSCAVCLVLLVRYNRDLMRQQPTLMCVCYHSGTYPFSVIRISFGSSFYRLLFPPLFFFLPLCLYFASLQTDSENRSLVRWRIRDGRSRQGRDLCGNCHAILMTAIHAVKCQTCTVTTL